MAVTYCTADDVRRVLSLTYQLSTSSTPTQADVEAFINSAEDEIDQRTQNSWQSKTVTNEFYDLSNYPHLLSGTGIKIFLRHRNIRALSVTAPADKIEIWDGSSYIDWFATKTEGRANDYWIDYEQGILYLRYWLPFYKEKALRLSYKYGEATVPKDIRDATAMLAATMMIQNDDKTILLNETGGNTINHSDRISKMQDRIDKILANRTEFIVV